jgi:hypothetical protein
MLRHKAWCCFAGSLVLLLERLDDEGIEASGQWCLGWGSRTSSEEERLRYFGGMGVRS